VLGTELGLPIAHPALNRVSPSHPSHRPRPCVKSRHERIRFQQKTGTLQSIINGFQKSTEYLRLADKTKKNYGRYIEQIDARFGTFPLSGLKDRRSRAIFKEWRDEIAAKSLRSADYGWTVLARILSWAFDRGLVDANPCERGGRLNSNSRADSVWTEDDEARFMDSASAPLKLALPQSE